MDFKDTTEEAAFRTEARAWLQANAPKADELEGLSYIEQSSEWQQPNWHKPCRVELL